MQSCNLKTFIKQLISAFTCTCVPVPSLWKTQFKVVHWWISLLSRCKVFIWSRVLFEKFNLLGIVDVFSKLLHVTLWLWLEEFNRILRRNSSWYSKWLYYDCARERVFYIINTECDDTKNVNITNKNTLEYN